MYHYIDERVLKIAEYILEKNETVRGAAAQFDCSKSTVHKYMTMRLRQLNPQLYEGVRKVLDQNKAERHIRGGEATKQKYLQENAEYNRGTHCPINKNEPSEGWSVLN